MKKLRFITTLGLTLCLAFGSVSLAYAEGGHVESVDVNSEDDWSCDPPDSVFVDEYDAESGTVVFNTLADPDTDYSEKYVADENTKVTINGQPASQNGTKYDGDPGGPYYVYTVTGDSGDTENKENKDSENKDTENKDSESKDEGESSNDKSASSGSHDDDDDDESSSEEPTTNNSASGSTSATGTTYSSPYTATLSSAFSFSTGSSTASLGNAGIKAEEPGPLAEAAFAAATPAGYAKAFAFSVTNGGQTTYTAKNGSISFKIPVQFVKNGRKFKLMGVDNNGNVKIFDNTSTDAGSFSANIDIEGYAFELVFAD